MNILLLIAIMLLIPSAVIHADESANYVPESRTLSEIFTSKVVKVYAFQDGNVDYTAYVVHWKDHEVVVTPLLPILSTKKYNVGDTIRCQLMQSTHTFGGRTVVRTTFVVAPVALDGIHDFHALDQETARQFAPPSPGSDSTPPKHESTSGGKSAPPPIPRQGQ